MFLREHNDVADVPPRNISNTSTVSYGSTSVPFLGSPLRRGRTGFQPVRVQQQCSPAGSLLLVYLGGMVPGVPGYHGTVPYPPWVPMVPPSQGPSRVPGSPVSLCPTEAGSPETHGSGHFLVTFPAFLGSQPKETESISQLLTEMYVPAPNQTKSVLNRKSRFWAARAAQNPAKLGFLAAFVRSVG